MSDSQSMIQLKSLSKEDLKNLAKQAQKDKRDQEAKTAKIRPQTYASMGSNVSFDAPVKVSEAAEDKRKMDRILGPYEASVTAIMSRKQHELMGVERQPSTPLPAKRQDKAFAFASSNRNANQISKKLYETGRTTSDTAVSQRAGDSRLSAYNDSHSASSNRTKNSATNMVASAENNTKPKSLNSVSGSSNRNSSSNAESSISTTVNSTSHRSDQKSEISSHNIKKTNVQKSVKPDNSVNLSVKKEKEPVTYSAKHQPISREPVLQSLKQELITGNLSKPNTNVNQLRPGSSSTKSSSNSQQSSTKSMERKDSKPSLDPFSVLQVKEENRNGAVNGAKLKHRPRLNIPEKNVEDMLKELTHLPQPLTGIQTPFKDSKFPFMDNTDMKPGHSDISTDLSSSHARTNNKVAIAMKTEPRQKVVEQITEKEDSSDDGDDNDDDDDDDDSSGGSSGSDSDDGNNMITEVEEREIKSDTEHDKIDTGGHVQAETVKILEQVPVTGSTTTMQSVHTAAPVKEPKPKTSCSSSESSSSDSDSSSGASESESDNDNEASEDEQPDSPPHKQEKTTPTKLKSSPDMYNMDTTPSPSSRPSWGLKSFLNKEPPLISLNAKPLSYEAPASDKSDPDHFDEVTDLKRGADHISDENPPSVDPDGFSKPMSADEFSPPAPIDKHSVLSPLKSPQPVKSPAKRSYHRSSAAERLKASKVSADPCVSYQNNTYDIIKNRERKTSTSNASPGVDESPKAKRRGRKPKSKAKSVPVKDDTSDSESESTEVDVVNCSISSENMANSPIKPLPKSPKKPLHYNTTPNDSSMCSTKPLSSTSKKKESKRDKLLKKEDSVKLKMEDPSAVYLAETPLKTIACDNKEVNTISNINKTSAQSGPYESDSIEKMLDSFSGGKPLSPIPNIPDVQDDSLCHTNLENLRKAGLEVATVKPFPLNGSVKCVNGTPSVLVQIDLNLLEKILILDKSSPEFGKMRLPYMSRESLTPEKDHSKHQKLTSPKQGIISNKLQSHKVLDERIESRSAKPLAPASKNRINTVHSHLPSASDKNSANLSDKVAPESVSKPNVSHKVQAADTIEKDAAILALDSLPDQVTALGHLSDESSSSDSSSSDSEIDEFKTVSRTSRHNSSASSVHSTFNQSPPDKKKRKLDTHRADDSKRRKTMSPHKQATIEVPKDELDHGDGGFSEHGSSSSNRKPVVKRERRSSTSSQHSTLSQHSSHSHHSSHSGNHSQKQKRVKVADTSSHDLKVASSSTPSSRTTSSHEKSSTSSGSSTSSSHKKHPIKTESIDVAKQNGYIPQSTQPPHDPIRKSRPVSSHLTHGKDNKEELLPADEYHHQAKKYKYQADAMDPGLTRHVLYMESLLCFLQCGYVMERKEQVMKASTMYKETQQLVSHQCHQFRVQHNPESHDKAEPKMTVLCLRIQSLIYLKLYMMKKNETMKLKKIIEDHQSKSMKSTSQSKLPSAPSPHQTNWNRSTGTPSPMSPSPSPANSVCSVGSVGSDQTPSKMTNGTNNSAPIAPHGHVLVTQRIHSITQKYLSNTSYLIQAHELWEQADHQVAANLQDYFAQLDYEVGPLTLHSSLLHLVKYVRQGLSHIKIK